MASSSKKRTTMAKIARENKLRERRIDKQARKDARKAAAGQPPEDTTETGDAWAEEPTAVSSPLGAEDSGE